jgi:hypothetical protein
MLAQWLVALVQDCTGGTARYQLAIAVAIAIDQLLAANLVTCPYRSGCLIPELNPHFAASASGRALQLPAKAVGNANRLTELERVVPAGCAAVRARRFLGAR